MNRRDILKQLAVLSGGVLLVPACDFSKNDILLVYDHLQVTKDNKATLQKLCDTIIPSDGQYKGADELALSDFVLVMVNDCYGPDDQSYFMEGLKKLDQYTNQQTRQNYQSLSQEHATELVQNIMQQPKAEAENSQDQAAIDFEQIRYFTQTTKSLTIQGYMASEYIMSEIMPYELVPGEFHGKVRIQENEKVNMYG